LCANIPPLSNQRYQQENGALLYCLKKRFDAMWTKLFLFEEEVPGFELVYDDSNYYSLALYGQNIIGPLKIWKINYPTNFSMDSKLRELYLKYFNS